MKKWNQRTLARNVLCAAAILFCFSWMLIPPPAVVQAQGEAKVGLIGVRGELIYVPIYSSIFYENGKSTLELAATLSIHNVNPNGKLTLVRADYYDTKGKLIKKYVDRPIALSPLETKNFVVDRSDTAGGTGANFLFEWQAPEPIVSPLVEAVMVNASSNLGIAFTTAGKVVKSSTGAPN